MNEIEIVARSAVQLMPGALCQPLLCASTTTLPNTTFLHPQVQRPRRRPPRPAAPRASSTLRSWPSCRQVPQVPGVTPQAPTLVQRRVRAHRRMAACIAWSQGECNISDIICGVQLWSMDECSVRSSRGT